MLKRCVLVLGTLLFGVVAVVAAAPPQFLPNLFPFPNSTGVLETFNTTGKVDLTGAFFQSLGTNDRSCATCHQASDAWTVSAAHVAERFEETAGLDPIFRTNDGSNCDHDIDVSTVEGRQNAYSLLISRGLIRIALKVPAGAEFDVVSVSNPYGCNDTSMLSMYRRPLPATNLRFLSTVMWDGRESSIQTGTKPIIFKLDNPNDLLFDLAHQSVDATNGHAQAATPPTQQQQQQIVAFEMALSTAQVIDSLAGPLNLQGATGGPVALVTQPFFVSINDPLGQNHFGTPFTPVIFTLFNASWANASSGDAAARRASILRGQTLFNSRTINITGVAGINDVIGKPLAGTCGTCHDTFNVGNHSVSAPLNIGVADLTNPLGVSYLPVITLRQKADPTKEISTTDPGRALVTGKWADIGKVKGPILRGLAARAPYFHNGSAASLQRVIDFYNIRFAMELTAQEQADLVAFLSVL
jgi:cytochrome c peroxidase